jgi:hypothetical protein
MNDNDIQPLSVGGERGRMRASDVDRDRVVELLNAAYCEGTRLHAAARWGSPRMIRTGQCA